MSVELQAYKALRIYRRLPTSLIFNSLLCNRIMKVPLFVNNASKIYKGIRSIFGLSLANALINHTFCKMLTAGNTIE